jgi:hypothetical protein
MNAWVHAINQSYAWKVRRQALNYNEKQGRGKQTARNYFAEVNVIDVEMGGGGVWGRWGKKLCKQVDSVESVTICHVEPG